MDTQEAKQLCERLMAEHGLLDWSFAWGSYKTTYGKCRYGKRIIELSFPLTSVGEPEDVRDTILHEIAHALVGRLPGKHRHHGLVWKQMAVRVGAKPNACSAHKNQLPSPWVAWCPSCGREATRFRFPKAGRKWSCAVCSRGRFNPRFLLEFHHRNNVKPPVQFNDQRAIASELQSCEDIITSKIQEANDGR